MNYFIKLRKLLIMVKNAGSTKSNAGGRDKNKIIKTNSDLIEKGE